MGRGAARMVDVSVVWPSQCEGAGWRVAEWLGEGRPTHSGRVSPAAGRFKATLDPSYVRNKQQLLGNMATRAEQLVDARPSPRFEGTITEPWTGRRSGNIPERRNVRYGELFDAKFGD